MKKIKIIIRVAGQNPETKEAAVSGQQPVAEVLETAGKSRIGLSVWNITVDGNPANPDTVITEESSYIDLQYRQCGN